MKTKITRLSRRGISALLSVLMAVSCLTFALMSTSAAETQGSSVSASAQDDGTVSASANDGTVAAQSDDDTVAASADDSGTVSAQSEGEEVGGSYDGSKLRIGKGTTSSNWSDIQEVTFSNDTATVTLDENTNYAFQIVYNEEYYGSGGSVTGTTTSWNTNLGGGINLTSKGAGEYTFKITGFTSNNKCLTFDVTYPTVAAKTYTVTAKTSTGGTICETSDGTYGTTDITFSGVSSDSPKQFYVKAADGYNFNNFTTTGGANVTYSTSNGVVTAKVTATADGTVTANFKAKGTTTGDNIYTASSTIDTHNTSETIDTSSVDATFFDYYSDSEVMYGWGFKDNSVLGGTVNNGTTTKHSTRLPFGVLNGALSSYASSNSSTIAYPLYFGDFYDYSSSGDPGLTNFWRSVNNSNALLATNKTDSSKEKYYYSVTGLAGSSLSSDYNTIYHANSDGSNGAAMKEFDAEWLTSAEKNGISTSSYSSTGKNSTGALASVINSKFPVRVETKSTSTTQTIYFLKNGKAASWSDVYCYAWNNSGDNTWPGTKMSDTGEDYTYNGTSYDVYSVTISSDFTSVVFNQGSDTDKSGDQSSFSDGQLFNYEANTWVDYKSATSGTTYKYYTYNSNEGQDNAWFTYDSTSGAITMNYSDDASTYGIVGTNYNNSNKDGEYGYGFFPLESGSTRSGARAENFGFGVKLQMNFTLGSGGKLTLSDGKTVDQVFEYSGDDDLWVYVDGQLVLDLGGDHKMSEGEINFADLTVTRNWAETPSCSDKSGTESFTNANSALANFDNNNTSTVHTLTIYYMERGMNESNLKFGFNFVPVSNNLEVSNTVDTSSVNESLKSKVDAAVSGTVAYDYSMTSTSDTDGFKDKTGSKSTTAKSSNEINLTTGENETFVDQFTASTGNTMYITQTLPSTATGYKFLTSYTVTDTANSNQVSNSSSYTGTVNGETTSSSSTGTFAFYTTKSNPSDLDATTYEVAAINEVQTADLTIGKTINATDASSTDTFTFTVKLKLPSDSDYSEQTFTYYKNGDTTTTDTATNGVVTLTAGSTITIPGLPVNTEVKIIESTNNAYALESITHTNWQSNDFTTDLDNNSATVTLGADDSVTVTNHPLTYRVDFVVPTRLYNDKVYQVSGNLSNLALGTDYTVSNGTYTFTKSFLVKNCPYEDIFTNDITWNFDNGVTASKNVSKTVTGDGTSKNDRTQTVQSYDLYGSIKYSDSTARLVDYKIYTDSTTYYTGSNLAYGSLIKQNDELVNNTDNTNFLYWSIYKMTSAGEKDTTTGEVARCHSQKFTYCLYEDYYIEAVYKTDSTSTDTNKTTAESYIGTTASYLDVTRSVWNDTTNGTDDDSTSLYYLANWDYDRMYVDFVLAFDYNNVLLNTNTDNNVKIGYEILNSSGTTVRTINIDKGELDEKNRVECYYGVKNTGVNATETFYIQSFITYVDDNGDTQTETSNKMEFTFSKISGLTYSTANNN